VNGIVRSMPTALIRAISPLLDEGGRTHITHDPIDLALARQQHAGYAEALAAAGWEVIALPEAPALPDATFVEDTAVVIGDVAILTRPGAEHRRPEVATVRPALEKFRPVVDLAPRSRLDGGDVLQVDDTVYVGLSQRTDQAGLNALRTVIDPALKVVPVPVTGCLHLKTGASNPAPGVILAVADWLDAGAFGDLEIIEPPEPSGANTLLAGGTVLVPASAPGTAALLRERGVDTQVVDIGEFHKAEAGLTCLSIIVP
jgi:dimethylargininase